MTDQPPANGHRDRIRAALSELLVAQRRLRSRDSRRRISTAQHRLLSFLIAQDGPPLSALAAAAEVTLPTLSQMINELEHVGFVVRGRSPHDGRVVTVSLTATGREAYAERDEMSLAVWDAAVAELGDRRVEEVVSALDWLRSVYDGL